MEKVLIYKIYNINIKLIMNYFNLFNLNFSYSINLKKLKNCYKKLQFKYHPDFFITKKIKKSTLTKKSAVINTGYSTLKNNLLRAEHMLNIKKIDINKEKYKIKDLNFLEKNLNLYEKLKYMNNEKQIDIFYKKIKKIKKTYLKKIEQELNFQKWTQAAKTLNKLKLIEKIKKKVKKIKIEKIINNFK